MENQEIQTPLLRLQTGGIVVGLLSLGAVAALMAGTPSVAAVSPAPIFALVESTDKPKLRFRDKCEECAVVTSIREIETLEHGIHSIAGSRTTKDAGNVVAGERVRRVEVTVQMRDGSTRVIKQARPASWRMNERLILIGGSSISKEPEAQLSLASDVR